MQPNVQKLLGDAAIHQCCILSCLLTYWRVYHQTDGGSWILHPEDPHYSEELEISRLIRTLTHSEVITLVLAQSSAKDLQMYCELIRLLLPNIKHFFPGLRAVVPHFPASHLQTCRHPHQCLSPRWPGCHCGWEGSCTAAEWLSSCNRWPQHSSAPQSL